MKTEGGCFTAMMKIIGVMLVIVIYLVLHNAPPTSCGYTYFPTPDCAADDAYITMTETFRSDGSTVPIPEKYWVLKEKRQEALMGGRGW